MSAPSFLEEPQVAYLSRILEDVKNGNILVPRFQRKFVWDDEDRVRLFDSIRQGIPIGSFLVWRTRDHQLDTFENIGGLPVPRPHDRTHGTAVQYLLDGHQRLSTLFGALSRCDDPSCAGDEEFGLQAGDVFYALVEQEFVILRRGKRPDSTWLPLNILFDSIALLKYQRSLVGLGSDSDRLIERVDALANRFRNYKIPVIPLVSDDLEAATTTFQRINSSGRHMDETHMIVALTYRKDYDLAAKFERVRTELEPVGWDDLDPKYILATIRARAGNSISEPNADGTSKLLRDRPEVIDDTVCAIKLAARFLRERCCIPSPEFLPYSYQAVMLTYAFMLDEEPDDEQLRALQRWLWTTTYTGFFRGARESDISRAKENVTRIMTGDGASFPFPATPVGSSLGRRFDFRDARAKALINRLVELYITEESYKTKSVLDAMASQGAKCVSRLIGKKMWDDKATSFGENCFLTFSVDELRDKLEKPLLDAPVDDGVVDGCLRAHGIPQGAMAAYRTKKYREFLGFRRKELERIEQQFVESLGLKYNRGE
jgi:hypothetical protein